MSKVEGEGSVVGFGFCEVVVGDAIGGCGAMEISSEMWGGIFWQRPHKSSTEVAAKMPRQPTKVGPFGSKYNLSFLDQLYQRCSNLIHPESSW